jgi:hypothetical protein
MKRPEDVTLSREEGEAVLARLEANTLTADPRRMLGKELTFYFWLLFAVREAKLSRKRLKALVFGEKPKKRDPSDRAVLGAVVEARVEAAGQRPRAGPLQQGREQRQPRSAAQGIGGREPTSMRSRSGSSVAMKSWRWGSAVQRVAAGDCIGYHQEWRCGWMAKPCCRRCAMTWRSCGARRVARCSPRRCPPQRARRNIAPGRGPS